MTNDDTNGPGKYDPLCTYVREQCNADAVALIVMGGALGNGFSVQAHDAYFARHRLPDLLEAMAKDIRAQSARYEPVPSRPAASNDDDEAL